VTALVIWTVVMAIGIACLPLVCIAERLLDPTGEEE
jgi:hypothetical protein